MCIFGSQSLGQMEVRGADMWCSVCHVPVQFKEKSYAKVHIGSATHKANVVKKPTYVEKPGAGGFALVG